MLKLRKQLAHFIIIIIIIIVIVRYRNLLYMLSVIYANSWDGSIFLGVFTLAVSS